MAVTKAEGSPDAKRVEAWSAPPEQYAICAPAPPKTTIVYEWPDPAEEDPERVVKVKVRLVADIDRFDLALPDYAYAFDWDVESPRARAQIAYYVRNGTGDMDDITARLGEDGITWIVGGRHRVLYARVANQIREYLGLGACKVRASRKKIPAIRASTAIVISNIRHRRDPAAEGREYAKVMHERNITAADLAKEIGETAAHVRRLLALAGKGAPRPSARAKVPRVLPRKRLARLVDYVNANSDEFGEDVAQLLRHILDPSEECPERFWGYINGGK